MLPIIPQDKANHFIYGALIGIVTGAVAIGMGRYPVGYVLLAGVFFGVAKEVLDHISNRKAIAAGLTPTHGVEVGDGVYTALGSASTVLLLLIRN